MGVRIFSDGLDEKSGTSNAATRRTARGQRRRHDRYLKRRGGLMQTLVEFGLMPPDNAERKAGQQLDPYRLRARPAAESAADLYPDRVMYQAEFDAIHKGRRRINHWTTRNGTDCGKSYFPSAPCAR